MSDDKGGRPPMYETPEDMQVKINEYFQKCEGEYLKDGEGNQVLDKYSKPIVINSRPPTVTGLALALGFSSRQALLNYQVKDEFNYTITRAKAYIEQYAEERLYDREGVQGAKFNLINNFKGWSESPKEDTQKDLINKLDEMIGAINDATKS